MKRPILLALALLAAAGIAVIVSLPKPPPRATPSPPRPASSQQFAKRHLTAEFAAEGAALGDLNGDGRLDIAYGSHWYEGPAFATRHAFKPKRTYDPAAYSDTFFLYIWDFSGDGRPDILHVGFPGADAQWYEAPDWTPHPAAGGVGGESPTFTDLTGDGRPELVYARDGVFGYASPPDWGFREIGPAPVQGPFVHGMGVGDVNGDGRADLLESTGWHERRSDGWTKHAADFGDGGAQMFAADIDGDGDADVVTSLQAHGWGVAWFEQTPDGWARHDIVDEAHRFSQPHALALVDIDGDGLRDVVTGKRHWAHGPTGDPDPGAPAVLYAFLLRRHPVRWEPLLIDDDSGVGVDVTTGDANGDGLTDVVIGNKKGCFLFTNQRRAERGDLFPPGDPRFWSVEGGEIVGRRGPHAENEWLVGDTIVDDFRLTFEVKLVGDAGNSGVQFRSAFDGGEMRGHQADIGPGWWGKLYEEGGRGLLSDRSGEPFVRPGEWNTYEIVAVGTRIRTSINGHVCADLSDPAGARRGVLALQIHGGAEERFEVRFRNFQLGPPTLLPPLHAGAPPHESPLTPQEQQALFAGATVELVASDPDLANVVDIAWDDAGRMWAVTAVEYPMDANETPGAEERYRRGGADRVLVIDEGGVRTFADNLFIPMAVLPYKDGVIIEHGPEVLFLRDTDADGRADTREVLLDGIGIQDSHLMPHRFTRGPGNWIYFAQGAFNTSQIRARDGSVTTFNFCKVGRFSPDGMKFERVASGLNNIWGLVIDRRGRMWIQEANDLGYPVAPLYLGASYPGFGEEREQPYAPWQPPTASFRMGGTGLSGLALAENGTTMFVANPIIGRVQAIELLPGGLRKLPDFLTCGDPWFRPIAVHFGPDGALYIIDWYNKIISHNEVPRNHPERDKTHGRIWRVGGRRPVRDLTRADDEQLLRSLRAELTWEARAAWHQIVDRGLRHLAPRLRELVRAGCLEALWCLIDLGELDDETARGLTGDLRREAVRGVRSAELLESWTDDPECQVELIHRLDDTRALLKIKPRSPFEAALLRAALEKREPVADVPEPARRIAWLAWDDARAFAASGLKPTEEEMAMLARHSGDPPVAAAILRDIDLALKVGGLANPEILVEPARRDPDLLIRVARAFKLRALEADLIALCPRADAVAALREIGSTRVDVFRAAALSEVPVQREAVLALAAVQNEAAVGALIELWPLIGESLRRAAVDRLAQAPDSARALIDAVRGDRISLDDVDLEALEKLRAVLGDDEELDAMWESVSSRMSKALRLSGGTVDANLTLDGPFTVEAWIKLEPGITNQDAVIGRPGEGDFNFAGGLFRAWFGPEEWDVIIARTPVEPDVWTHVAITRGADGRLALYLNGELDTDRCTPSKRALRRLDVGHANAPGGTGALMTELRVWTTARTADEIRRDHRVRFEERPEGLAYRDDWGRARGGARVVGTLDDPGLMTAGESRAVEARFARYLALAGEPGDENLGAKIFTDTCLKCHGERRIGPPLDGIGLKRPEEILRAVLTPSAGIESGYRVMRVTRTDGTILEGFLASQDADTITLRRVDEEDLRIPRAEIRSLRFQRKSLMPEGQLEALTDDEARALLTYLRTIR